jgi:hypothetical protein
LYILPPSIPQCQDKILKKLVNFLPFFGRTPFLAQKRGKNHHKIFDFNAFLSSE